MSFYQELSGQQLISAQKWSACQWPGLLTWCFRSVFFAYQGMVFPLLELHFASEP